MWSTTYSGLWACCIRSSLSGEVETVPSLCSPFGQRILVGFPLQRVVPPNRMSCRRWTTTHQGRGVASDRAQSFRCRTTPSLLRVRKSQDIAHGVLPENLFVCFENEGGPAGSSKNPSRLIAKATACIALRRKGVGKASEKCPARPVTCREVAAVDGRLR